MWPRRTTRRPPMVEDRLSPEQIDVLLTAAVAAPSMHNTQPWRFEVSGHVIDVFLDSSRALPAEDPSGRALRIAAGAATFNLRCAAASMGYHTWLGLMPCPEEEPDLVARIVTEPAGVPDQELSVLYAEIPRRHTSRAPVQDESITQDLRIALIQEAFKEKAELTWLGDAQTERILDLVREADLREIGDWHRSAERARWVGRRQGADGIPSAALGPRSATYPGVVRDLATAPLDRSRPSAAFEQHPSIAVLSTAGDEPADHVAAGLALERVLLVATRRGATASFLNQPLEHDDLRRAVQRTIQGTTRKSGFAHMVIRFGRGRAAATTGRRPTQDFIDNPEES
ncbi:Acg family FMN-binding oxidoreductase [Kribbella sp. NPDC050124]|uniref:Acg family FMN-binding oxidoreductase n=1 Tax=Kribbella sp. NPDC050124 TaxID=3364114 RepID=UPI003787B37C